MSCNKLFKSTRSNFYVQVFENDDNITLNANSFTATLISDYHNGIEHLSPTGWRPSKNFVNLYNLWIPENRIDYTVVDLFFEWAETCNSCVWVRLNKNIEKHFCDDSLDFCICSDWNYNFDGISGHTEIGELEYKLKYGESVSDEENTVIAQYLKKCISCVSEGLENVLVTTIPAVIEKQQKASWELAHFVANELNSDFLTMTLMNDKPQMKSVDVSTKIRMWHHIYTNDLIELSIKSNCLHGKTVIIVDDLYQSGASMWCCAEYLKSLGVRNAIGIALVKSLKDSDNT